VGSVLLQPHVLRRVAAARLRHRSPLLASSPGRAPEGFWLPTKGRAARWERVRVVEIWVNNEVDVGCGFRLGSTKGQSRFGRASKAKRCAFDHFFATQPFRLSITKVEVIS
jgi:hypothetical protein